MVERKSICIRGTVKRQGKVCFRPPILSAWVLPTKWSFGSDWRQLGGSCQWWFVFGGQACCSALLCAQGSPTKDMSVMPKVKTPACEPGCQSGIRDSGRRQRASKREMTLSFCWLFKPKSFSIFPWLCRNGSLYSMAHGLSWASWCLGFWWSAVHGHPSVYVERAESRDFRLRTWGAGNECRAKSNS